MITLIGKKLAKPGQEFIHYGVGKSRECFGCKLRKVCDNLEVGRRYVVKSSMNKPHEKCKIHDEGVMLVEVELADVKAFIPTRQAVEGATITYMKPSCSKLSCEYSDLCFPEGVRDGDKCEVAKVLEKKVNCEAGDMTLVSLRPCLSNKD